MSAKLIYISDSGKLFWKLFDHNPDIAKPVQSDFQIRLLRVLAFLMRNINNYHFTCTFFPFLTYSP